MFHILFVLSNHLHEITYMRLLQLNTNLLKSITILIGSPNLETQMYIAMLTLSIKAVII